MNIVFRRCVDGYVRLWDGLRQPGRYPYPPNTFCGSYNNGEISVRKLSTNAASEIEYLTPNSHPQSTFTITYKYVNMGELKKHLPWVDPLGRSPGQDTSMCMTPRVPAELCTVRYLGT